MESPTFAQRLEAAELLLEEGRCWTISVENVRNSGPFPIRVAVETGGSFYGSLLPWVWGIDVDDASPFVYKRLLTSLSDRELDYIEADSGNTERIGRHLFVYDPGGEACEQMATRPAGEGLDWRRQGTIRPLFSPHRSSGRFSEPLNMSRTEALGKLRAWRAEQTAEIVLPAWAEALARRDWAKAERLDHAPSKNGARIDRSAVDVSIGLAVRNAGGDWLDFSAIRRPGGKWPSPKAEEQSDPSAYLRRQWDAVLSRPVVAPNPDRHDAELLPGFLAAVKRDVDLSDGECKALTALGECGVERSVTTVGVTYMDIAARCGVADSTIVAAVNGDGFLRYAEPQRYDKKQRHDGHARRYRLRVREVHNFTSTCTELGGDSVRTSETVHIPSPTHPLFWNRPGLLGGAAFAALRGFSVDEPRSIAQAAKIAGRHRNSVGSMAKKLAGYAVLSNVGTETRPTYLLVPTDWDALAASLGVSTHMLRLADRQRAQQTERLNYLDYKQWISPDDSDDRRRAVRRRHAEQASRAKAFQVPSQSASSDRPDMDVPAGGRRIVVNNAGRDIDRATGEILRTVNDENAALSMPSECRSTALCGSLLHETPADAELHPKSVEGHTEAVPWIGWPGPANNCAACGYLCDTFDTDTGMRWHPDCLMPVWIAGIYERLGVTVPLHRIAPIPPAATVDRCGIDWSDEAEIVAPPDRRLAAMMAA